MRRLVRFLAFVLTMSVCPVFIGVGAGEASDWYFGFGVRTIRSGNPHEEPLYIAGYHSGVELTGVMDECQVRSVWLDVGGTGVLLIGVDCIALDRGTVDLIRGALTDLPEGTCVNVYATGTHSGADTLGLWGPSWKDGKNEAYMNALIAAAVESAREARGNRQPASMVFGRIQTWGLLGSNLCSGENDGYLCQLRLTPLGGGRGLRMLFYDADPALLGSQNTLMSRDYPGQLCDSVSEATGDDVLFLPGAVGGSPSMDEEDPGESCSNGNSLNMARRLTAYVLQIEPDDERLLRPELAVSRVEFPVPMENLRLMTCQMLGILNGRLIRPEGERGSCVETELSVLILDDLALALIPGKIFPELVRDNSQGRSGSLEGELRPLEEVVGGFGFEDLLVAGLANDTLGSIVPPWELPGQTMQLDFIRLLNGEEASMVAGADSVGPECAARVADALQTAFEQL
ncbi:MAG: hypothetical protein U0L09_02605 [Christensenellales bacterium]|nr:hypothetical protein [Christensenellales bacterium]